MKSPRHIALFVALAVAATSLTARAEETAGASRLPPVKRAEAIAVAEAYRLHVWTPTAANAFHGRDAQGVPVDTPDAAFRPTNGTRPGWWQLGQANVGVPYMWGGFSSLAEFDLGLRTGRYAGDVYTAYKRAKLDDAVSRQAVGIDCSGLISRCWKLPRAYSTRELAGLCNPLRSTDELCPGDILNLHNAHVLLFVEFTDATKTRLAAYEAGSPPTWKVLLNDMPVRFLTDQGYAPYRYRNIVD